MSDDPPKLSVSEFQRQLRYAEIIGRAVRQIPAEERLGMIIGLVIGELVLVCGGDYDAAERLLVANARVQWKASEHLRTAPDAVFMRKVAMDRIAKLDDEKP